MNHKKHDHKGHMLLMLICCLAPILIFGAVRFSGIGGAGLSRILTPLIFLLCPLMHIFMMKGMMGNKGSCHDEKDENQIEQNLDSKKM